MRFLDRNRTATRIGNGALINPRPDRTRDRAVWFGAGVGMSATPFNPDLALTPGAPRAVAMGCVCPVETNEGGQGIQGTHGKDARYWVHDHCPLHEMAGPETGLWRQRALELRGTVLDRMVSDAEAGA